MHGLATDSLENLGSIPTYTSFCQNLPEVVKTATDGDINLYFKLEIINNVTFKNTVTYLMALLKLNCQKKMLQLPLKLLT